MYYYSINLNDAYAVSHLHHLICTHHTDGLVLNRKPADLIITGGKIYTLDPQQPEAEAVVVKDGKIVYAGNLEGTKKYKITRP